MLSLLFCVYLIILFYTYNKYKNRISYRWLKIYKEDCISYTSTLTVSFLQKNNKPDCIYLYFYKGCLIATEDFYENINTSFVKSKINSFVFEPLLIPEKQFITSKRKDINDFLISIIKKHKNSLERSNHIDRKYTLSILSKLLSQSTFNTIKEFTIN